MLPGITQIHVVADGYHQASLVVIDATPAGFVTVVLPNMVGRVQHLLAGYLVAIVQIEDSVEDGVFVVNTHNRPVRKNAAHAGDENLPLVRPVEVVAHEKTAAQQEIAHFSRLLVRQSPMPNFDAIQPGPVVNIIAVIQIHRLLDGAGLDAGQAAKRGREMPVRARIVDGPVRPAGQPVPKAPVAESDVGIHQSGEGPFTGQLPIRWFWKVVVFPPRIITKFALAEGHAREQRARPSPEPFETPAHHTGLMRGMLPRCTHPSLLMSRMPQSFPPAPVPGPQLYWTKCHKLTQDQSNAWLRSGCASRAHSRSWRHC